MIRNKISAFIIWSGLLLAFLVTPISAYAASLSMNPSSGVINKGCDFTVKIELDTQGVQTDGTDVIVIYSPAQLSITTADITNGTVYPQYPGNSVDSTGGKISISGISEISGPFTGTGTFATMKFRVSDTAAVNSPISLKFDFDANNKTKTTDTNVIERGTIADVLNAVTDGNYTVGGGTCAGGNGISSGTNGTLTGVNGQGQVLPGTPGYTGSDSAQYQVYKPTLNDVTGGKAGLIDNTIMIASFGIILVILGIAGLAML